jgi:hypothetical protein
MVTKVDLSAILRGLNNDEITLISLGVFFVAVIQMYVVTARSFFGRTLGEWTFDVQLGKTEDQSKTFYPLKVVARSLLVTATGLIVLPILSLVVGRDLAGDLLGLHLYQQQ